MTRKDYALIAGELRELYLDLESDGVGDETTSARLNFDKFVSRLSRKLKADNPNFKDETFRKVIYK